MEVEILDYTDCPATLISLVAGTSYGKDDAKLSRVEGCFANGHMGVFEHAYITFKVKGISRACSHQLVRHRMASFVQESQRYVRVAADSDDWYVRPPESFGSWRDIEDMDADDWFGDIMGCFAQAYQVALDNGIKPEDARFLLPQATKTTITVTMNLRELYHFFDLRLDSHAQWEIREMADALLLKIVEIDDEWAYLMTLWEGKDDDDA